MIIGIIFIFFTIIFTYFMMHRNFIEKFTMDITNENSEIIITNLHSKIMMFFECLKKKWNNP